MWDVYYTGVITLCNTIAIVGGAILMIYKAVKKAKEPTDNLNSRVTKLEESVREYDELNIKRNLHDLRHGQDQLAEQQKLLSKRLDSIDDGIGLIIKYTLSNPEEQQDIVDYLTKRRL